MTLQSEARAALCDRCPLCVAACAAAAQTLDDKTPFIPIDPGICADRDPNCKNWAAAGECVRNAKFMTGDLGNPGHCSLACGSCKPCAKDDKACYDENRRKAGFLVYKDLDSD